MYKSLVCASAVLCCSLAIGDTITIQDYSGQQQTVYNGIIDLFDADNNLVSITLSSSTTSVSDSVFFGSFEDESIWTLLTTNDNGTMATAFKCAKIVYENSIFVNVTIYGRQVPIVIVN